MRCAKFTRFKFFILAFTVAFAISAFYSIPANANLDPKVKALSIMAAYGTIGGALLGTASLAFGASSRSIARGASLGLYAGLIFGSVVVLTHAAKTKGWTKDESYYPDTPASPYEEGYEGGGEKFYEDAEQRWRFNLPQENSSFYDNRHFLNRKNGRVHDYPLFYMNFLNVFF